MERLAVFVDYANLDFGLREAGLPTEIPRVLQYICEGRWLLEAFCYLGTNPHDPDASKKRIRSLRRAGFVTIHKVAKVRDGGELKCDLDLELALGAYEFAVKVKPDIVVIASGDGDFAPLVERLRHLGIRVEVASTEATLSRDLKEAASGWIDLTVAFEEHEQFQEFAASNSAAQSDYERR